MTEQVKSEETVARCAIHPRYLNPKGSVGPWDPTYLLDIKRVGKEFVHKTSVVSRRLLTEVFEVHSYGCRSAELSNLGKNRSFEEAAHYIGFYDVSVADCEKQSNDTYRVYVEAYPERGEEAHCHIVLQEMPDLSRDQQKLKGQRRTDVITGIWESMVGPERWVCECDAAHADILNAKFLPKGGSSA